MEKNLNFYPASLPYGGSTNKEDPKPPIWGVEGEKNRRKKKN